MPEIHSKLSPSAADRWMVCPGSVVLCEGLPEKSSPYAEEGTHAHSVAEAMLKGKVFEATEEMVEHVQVYVHAIKDLVVTGCRLHTEVQVKVTEQIWGTADAIVWNPTTATLYVRDLKYGAGVPVEVSDNKQLKIYALAALLTMGYPAKVINVGIIQPRLPHADGFSRSKDYDSVDLIEFHSELMVAEKRVALAVEHGNCGGSMDMWLTPSDKGCRWCLAAPHCPKLKNKANEIAKQVFTVDTPYDPAALSHTLDMLPVMEAWIKNVREFAYSEAEKGNPIPNYKLVPKRADRKWKSDIDFELASALGVELRELYGPAPMKGVTEIQKLAPGKNDKERACVLEPFVTKESTGHTLVHDSDKRDAIRVDAKAAFQELS